MKLRKKKKNSGLNGVRTHEFAIPMQCSNRLSLSVKRNQMKNNLRSCEHNLCNCLRSLKKSSDFFFRLLTQVHLLHFSWTLTPFGYPILKGSNRERNAEKGKNDTLFKVRDPQLPHPIGQHIPI